MTLQTALIIVGITIMIIVVVISKWKGKEIIIKNKKKERIKAGKKRDEPVINAANTIEEVDDVPILEHQIGDNINLPFSLKRAMQGSMQSTLSSFSQQKKGIKAEQKAKKNVQKRSPKIYSTKPPGVNERSGKYLGRSTKNKEANKINGFSKISQIDYWAKIFGAKDLSRDVIMAIYREGESVLTKVHNIYGLRRPGKVWVDLEIESEDTRLTDLVLTIQLVDKNGIILESELDTFVNLVNKLGQRTNRRCTFMASTENALLQAQKTQSFCQQYGVSYVLNIKPEYGQEFNGSSVDRFARQLGLEPGENGYYNRNKRVGRRQVLLYNLANMSETGKFNFDDMAHFNSLGLTFFFNPASLHSPAIVFTEMVDTAKAFAARIKGEVVVPGMEVVTSDSFNHIRKSIEILAQDMKQAGIASGSDEAIRLF